MKYYCIKANLPRTQMEYEEGNGEGCWFIVDRSTKEAYDRNNIGSNFVGVLDNDSLFYEGLQHGVTLPIEMRGVFRAVVPVEALQKWKVADEWKTEFEEDYYE